MFSSPTNRKIICASIDEALPEHLKNRLLINKHMQMFITEQLDTKKSIIENNKAFLLFHIKASQIETFDFDNELKNQQLDFEEVITLKKPQPIHFEENITNDILDENKMENELRIKMEERQQEIEKILSQQKPIVIEKESTSIHEQKNDKNERYEKYDKYEKYQEKSPEAKQVSFQEPETDISSKKMDVILLELNTIKQEIIELKKMFVILTNINPNESRNPSQP